MNTPPMEGQQPADPAALATTYVAAWQEHDWARLRSILADDVTFRGPLGRADSADECIAGLRAMARTLDHIDVRARLSDDTQVITWFDLYSTIAPPTPTANWTRVRDGKITSIRVAFDPRAILAGPPQTGGTSAGRRVT
jgi:ketosteroid isomerase-like protein